MTAEIICALVLVAVALRLTAPWMAKSWRVVAAALVFAVALSPYPWGLAGWAQSWFGEFSISTGLLALVAIQHRIRGVSLVPTDELGGACMVIGGLAVVFYPMSLGATYPDPYALGYGSFLFSSLLLLLGLLAWVFHAYASCLLLVLAQVAYGLNLLSSDNLWDYLLDPILCVWALGWLVRDWFRRRAPSGAQPAPGVQARDVPADSQQ